MYRSRIQYLLSIDIIGFSKMKVSDSLHNYSFPLPHSKLSLNLSSAVLFHLRGDILIEVDGSGWWSFCVYFEIDERSSRLASIATAEGGRGVWGGGVASYVQILQKFTIISFAK